MADRFILYDLILYEMVINVNFCFIKKFLFHYCVTNLIFNSVQYTMVIMLKDGRHVMRCTLLSSPILIKTPLIHYYMYHELYTS